MCFRYFSLLSFYAILSITNLCFAQTPAQISDFSRAAKLDDPGQVRTLLIAGISPNTVDAKGDPMLVIAIRDKSALVTELLLNQKSTDVDLSNLNGETPLMMASITGNLPVVKKLVLEKKAKIDHIGWTPLHYACAKGQIEVAQFLVANGADVNSRSLNGTTPLMMAAQSGNEPLIKFLLDNGADIQLRNELGFSVIDIAEIYQKPWIAKGLESRWQKLYKEPYPGPKRNISRDAS